MTEPVEQMPVEDCIGYMRGMADQVRSWLEWNKKQRDAEPHLTTDDGTHIMCLPVPYWPSRGAFETWVKTLEESAKRLESKS